jgi:histone H3/H4
MVATTAERMAARAAQKKYGDKIQKRLKLKLNAAKGASRRKQENPKQRKPIRWKWRTVARREIRREIKNSSKKPAMPRAAIERVIRELAPGYQFEQEAMAQLRAAAEAHVVAALEAARFVADAESVPTLDRRHMQVVAAITNKMTTPTPLPNAIEMAIASSVEPAAPEPVVSSPPLPEVVTEE